MDPTNPLLIREIVVEDIFENENPHVIPLKQPQQNPPANELPAAAGPVVHPLLIEHVLNQVALSLCPRDLAAAFEVHPIWQQVIGVQPSPPPVFVDGKMTDPDGLAYLDYIRRDSFFMSKIFYFINADLDSTNVKELLKLNGPNIEELDLNYWSFDQFVKVQTQPLQLLTAAALGDLLGNQTPNLQTLSIKQLPLHIRKANLNLFPKEGANLKLTTIRIFLDYDSASAPSPNSSAPGLLTHALQRSDDQDRHGSVGTSGMTFVNELFANCPNLKNVAIVDRKFRSSIKSGSQAQCRVHEPRTRSVHEPQQLAEVQEIVQALIQTHRLQEITELEIDRMDYSLLWMLSARLNDNQLRSLKIRQLYKAGVSSKHPRTFYTGQEILLQLLTAQRSSLEVLKIKIVCHSAGSLILPPMPNLTKLRLWLVKSSRYHDFGQVEEPEPDRNGNLSSFFSITVHLVDFPQLQTLGLNGSRGDFGGRAGLCSDLDLTRPSHNFKILKDIPIGVDQTLMARIGQFFPKLSVIRTMIPYAYEELLISIWKFCPSVTDLSFTFAEDIKWPPQPYDEEEEQERQGLDSIFSGIPESECENLRLVAKEEGGLGGRLPQLNFNHLRAGAPSICDLRKLKTLSVAGPRCRNIAGPLNGLGPLGGRKDKLSDVFGYSTLAALSLEFQEFDTRRGFGLIELSAPCIQHICHRMRLEHVTEGKPSFCPGSGRLVRLPGAGGSGSVSGGL